MLSASSRWFNPTSQSFSGSEVADGGPFADSSARAPSGLPGDRPARAEAEFRTSICSPKTWSYSSLILCLSRLWYGRIDAKKYELPCVAVEGVPDAAWLVRRRLACRSTDAAKRRFTRVRGHVLLHALWITRTTTDHETFRY